MSVSVPFSMSRQRSNVTAIVLSSTMLAAVCGSAIGQEEAKESTTNKEQQAPVKLQIGATDVYANRKGEQPKVANTDYLDLSLFPGYRETAGPDGVDVPLDLWTHADFPGGLLPGANYGISFVDYDMDGWLDIFVCDSARLWRGIESGGTRSFQFVADLDSVLPSTSARYCSSFADYDNDGDMDIATGPRNWGGDDEVHLLKNNGAGQFLDAFNISGVVDVQPWGNSEGIAWADVDCDGYLDMFCPIYPAWQGGPGNFFLHNQGPNDLTGEYTFIEKVDDVGLDNPVGTYRPEGVQFVDYDFDGDLDLYSNGVLYRNISGQGDPLFEAMADNASGIDFEHILDEGAGFIDYDNDGDFDLGVMYHGTATTRLWENRGDGSYFEVDASIIDGSSSGGAFGFCVVDWDMDGDMDMTDARVWRRNMLTETGVPGFQIATHDIPTSHVIHPLPAWGDFDKDGDLDCALGNWGQQSHFYVNHTYDAATAPDERRQLRIRPMRDSDDVPQGLHTEYGATAEVHLSPTVSELGDVNRRVRQFVTTGQPYLNQGEYTLHFAMPPDPDPADPRVDVMFDISVAFSCLPEHGNWCVDKHVNPVLGGINLADLDGHREIAVYRSGKVIINDVVYEPGTESPQLTTAGGGLRVPPVNGPIASPMQVSPNSFAGIDISTVGHSAPVRVTEIILDGTIVNATDCGGQIGNVRLWDVTVPGAPTIVEDATLHMAPASRNRRVYYRTNMILAPGRSYRLVAPVQLIRSSDFSGPEVHDNVTIQGALLFTDTEPCNGDAVETAATLDDRLYMTVRFRDIGSVGADLDGDGIVATSDLLLLLGLWGPCPAPPAQCPADFDGDGMVGVSDLLFMLSMWT